MSEYVLRKRYSNFSGLDLKSNDLTRQDTFASDMMNAQYRDDGAIVKRLGRKPHADSQGGFGAFSFAKVNPNTGAVTQEALVCSDKLYRVKDTTLSVSYSGANTLMLFSLLYNESANEYKVTITDGVTEYLSQNIDLGIDEITPFTVAQLVTALNLVSGITASATGDTSIAAAYLDAVKEYDLVSLGSLSLKAGYYEEVNSPATPFPGSETNKAADDFENISGTNLQNVLYLSNGYDELKKYDGQNIYRAGLPTPVLPTATFGAGANTYTWKIQYAQKDAAGNLIEGNHTSSIEYTSVGLPATLTLTNILAASGFNTNCAVVNGIQAGVTTITVDNGSGGNHTMKIGDTAYFYDGVSAQYVEREITNITATTITIAGAAVNVADNAVISNNLRINIYRTINGGIDFYFVAEIPNNSFTATQTFVDNLSDATIEAQGIFVEPLTLRDAPPKGKYITQFQGLLIVTGNAELKNTVFFSDSDSPEYFPTDTNSFDIETVTSGFISGAAPNNNVLAIFKDRSVHIVSGNLAELTFRVDQVSFDIGCSSHHSISEIDGALVWLSDRGPYAMTSGQVPVPLMDGLIDNAFITTGKISEETPVLKRAIGFTHRRDKQWWLMLPCETVRGSDIETNSNTLVFVFDYYRKAFYKWNNINFAGGIFEKSGTYYLSERRYSTSALAVVHYLHKQLKLDNNNDYCDHNEAIEFTYYPQWDAGGEPSVLKRFLRLKYFGSEITDGSTPIVNVKTEINYVSDDIKADIELDFSGFGYGETPYALYGYGDYRPLESQHKLNTGRIRSLRVSFHNSEKLQNVEILGWELEIAYPYRTGLKK